QFLRRRRRRREPRRRRTAERQPAESRVPRRSHGIWQGASTKLVRLLFETATNQTEPKEHYHLSKHDISDTLKELSRRTDVMPDELARLEFLYIEALDH